MFFDFRRIQMKKLFSLLWCLSLISVRLQALDYEAKGVHYMAEFYDCDLEKLSNTRSLKNAMLEAVKNCGAHVLKECHHDFEPGDGFTQLILLSESHASIHTYPEANMCFIDLFTCGDHCDYTKFETAITQYLGNPRVHSRTFHRE